ncbi:M14 family metallopeptidase [Halalkalibaculum sp. DA3122]|uniref:M14 family metallopeptidase n=1 Tax=Halalkalibaculum sp. DA3122 TaxID=3373607 RepID=UPI00375457C3
MIKRIHKLLLYVAGFLLVSPVLVQAQSDLQSPEDFLGYKLGAEWTPHYKVMDYIRQVAGASPMVQLQQYGRSNEGRALTYLIVSSEENIGRSEEIRINNLRRTGLAEGSSTEDSTAIVWLSYNVHGNEASGSEAAMKTLYELVRPGNDHVGRWLKNTMVIMDPMLNPDGRDRYVHWYKETAGDEANPHADAREHNEPWPGGRTNHYYFDLNRDWAWLTQKESRQRNEIFQQWLPHIHVDFHEQNHNAPYYFAPAAEPFHKAITEWQRQFQYTIGKNHADYFDANNWLYFTREVFDLFYPSYGDTYPTYNGSIGMTYEQAGQAGLRIIQAEGDTLTLRDRLTHHVTTGLSTIEIASRHAKEIVHEFAAYYRQSRENPAGKYKTYVISGDNNPDKLRSLFSLLEKHRVRYGMAPREETYTGNNYQTGEYEQFDLTTDDYLVSAYQPKSVLARIFFEPNPELTDSVTYDITAWGQHYAFGLDGYALKERVDPVPGQPPVPRVQNEGAGTPYAYLAEWKSLSDMRMVAALLQKGIDIHIAGSQFVIDGTRYDPGTLVITRNANAELGAQFDQVVQQTANGFGQPLYPVSTGWVDSGPNFGSDSFRFLEKPRVAVLSGKGTSAGNVGEIWHFFDRQINYPVTLVDSGYFDNVDLQRYDLLILPGGSYAGIIDDDRLRAIREWVAGGGRLVALRQANAFLSGREGFSLTTKEESKSKDSDPAYGTSFYKQQRERVSEANSGSVFKILIDASHPLGYGLGDTYFSLKLDTDAYRYLQDGWNVGIARKDAHLSGFIGYRAEQELEQTLTFGVQEIGEGRVVYMIDNPLFRAFWHNGNLLFGNAVFMVGQ